MVLVLLKAGFSYLDAINLDEVDFNAYFDDIIALHKSPKKEESGARAKTYTIEIDDE